MLLFYFCLLFVLSLYGFHRFHISWLYLRKRNTVPKTIKQNYPFVTIQLPVYNEENVINRLLRAIGNIDWPKEKLQIQVLDDSTDETIVRTKNIVAQLHQQGFDIELLQREHRSGYKAGALAAALPRSKGEFIAIFDADFIPQPTFLLEVMRYFTDPTIGLVQARWSHYNREENLLTSLSSILLDGHFVLEHTARHRSGLFFNFNGTAGVWRKQCIVDSGGWSADTITEDLDLSYRAQIQGWRFIYLKDLTVPAEVPNQMRSFQSQQFRWAKGTMQTAKKLLIPLWKSKQSLAIKLEGTVHFTSNIAYPLTLLLIILMPIVSSLRLDPSLWFLHYLMLTAFITTTSSIVFFYALSQREAKQTVTVWKLILTLALGIGLSCKQSLAVFQGLFGNDRTFIRTPKAGDLSTKQYKLPNSIISYVEFGIGCYLLIGCYFLLELQNWLTIPFLALFAVGFLYVSITSLFPTVSRLNVAKKNDLAVSSDHG